MNILIEIILIGGVKEFKMVNPRFIELARRLMNEKVPGEKVIKSKLEGNSEEMPIINLTPFPPPTLINLH